MSVAFSTRSLIPYQLPETSLPIKNWLAIIVVTVVVNYGIWKSISYVYHPILNKDQTEQWVSLDDFVIYQQEEPEEILPEPPVHEEVLQEVQPIPEPPTYQISSADLGGLEMNVQISINPNELVMKPNQIPVQSISDARPLQTSVTAVLQGTPLLRIPPNYPPQAQARGVEGRVVVEYTLDKNGAPHDIQVIDEQPKGYFRQATLRAISRWRFQVDPNLPMTTRYQTEIKYRLER